MPWNTLHRSSAGLAVFTAAFYLLRADPGDVEDSHDYPGFARPAGFVIADYDEDNPAGFDFPVSRPLPMDADHVEHVHVDGHRLVIHYELGTNGTPMSIMDVQQHYEKAATDAGFNLEKTGAVGDVSETFHQKKGNRERWVYLEPGSMTATLTIVEPVPIAAQPPSVPPKAERAVTPASEDPLYLALIKKGRVVLPVQFLPSKADLDVETQPIIDRVVHLMRQHPDLSIHIEGHTDATDDDAADRDLSTQRARTVQAMLIMSGIAKDRLDAVGYGGNVPVASNKSVEGRALNRRIELTIWKK